MRYLIALIVLTLGCGQLFVTIRGLVKLWGKDSKLPKFIYFALLYGSAFGLLLVFSSLDIIFKWI